MEHDMMTTGSSDPAATAFDRLRREVTTLRLAVEQLADGPGKIEIPDYTETLTQISGGIATTHKALRTLAERPAIALTPDALAQQIAAAGLAARQTEEAALTGATGTFVKLAGELTGLVDSARLASIQNLRLLQTGGRGFPRSRATFVDISRCGRARRTRKLALAGADGCPDDADGYVARGAEDDGSGQTAGLGNATVGGAIYRK